MVSSEKQTKTSCKKMVKCKKLPVTQNPCKYETSYGQMRYLMKRLNTVLSNKLREGRPSRFCKICNAEIQQLAKTRHPKRRRLAEPRRKMKQHWPDTPRRPTSLPLKNIKRKRKSEDKQSQTVAENCAES